MIEALLGARRRHRLHVALVEAVHEFTDSGDHVGLVGCGSRQGGYNGKGEREQEF